MSGLEIVMVILGIGLIAVSYIFAGREGIKSSNQEKTTSNVQISVEQFFEDNREVLNRHMVALLDDTYEVWKEDTKDELGTITNEKIMAFQEFSDQIMEKIDSNHQEVVFLYDMLTKKEDEMKKLIQTLDQTRVKTESGLTQTQRTAKKRTESGKVSAKTEQKPPVKDLQSEKLEQKVQAKQGKKPVGTVGDNSNDRILSLYQEGKSVVEISKILGKGQGEVKLVIDLFQGR